MSEQMLIAGAVIARGPNLYTLRSRYSTHEGKNRVVANSVLGPTMVSMQCLAADMALVYGTKLMRERYQFLHSTLLHTLAMSALSKRKLACLEIIRTYLYTWVGLLTLK